MTPNPFSLAAAAERAGDLAQERTGDAELTGLCIDSRSVRPGDLFVCVPGTVRDGHEFGEAAVSAGAAALCVERLLAVDVPQLRVSDARRATGRIAALMEGDPAEGLLLLGVTGTNGKTTTAYLIHSILVAAGRTAGLIGTIETRIGERTAPGVRTTPDSVELQGTLREMRDAMVDSVAMEVTSHALTLHRVEGLRFAAAAFTNLSQDHLDFHAGMEDYFEAKRSLFTSERADAGAANIEDPYGRRLIELSSIPCIGFGTSPEADVRAERIDIGAWRNSFVIVTRGDRIPVGEMKISTPLVGAFNVSNFLAAAATCALAGISLGAIERGLNSLTVVPGRFEPVDEGQPFSMVVDYAHTPDSLDNVLREARRVADLTGGRVIAVFGCGGDRDRGKRPLMGAAAARGSDFCVVTSDNPRSEDPAAIIDQILEGILAEAPKGPDVVEPDRKKAIEAAIRSAEPGDIVVIAGKGHETGQEFADRTIPFDDRVVARSVLNELGFADGPGIQR